MDFYEFKAALAEKITSKEQFDKLLLEMNSGNTNYIGAAAVKTSGGSVLHSERVYNIGGLFPGAANEFYELCFAPISGLSYNRFHYTRWWMVREWMRVKVGIYQMTEPLWNLAQQGFADWCAHCTTKTDDPTLVAYTPDATAGEADRQITIAFGKLMRKLSTAAADSVVQDVEASHRADMSMELEILPPSEFVKVMLEIGEHSNGLSSCMSKPMSYWSKSEGHHPYEVYDAPGFGMAVSRNGSGKINARSIVWVNPDNADDKRFVRIYGDGALRRRLLRHGYRMAGLEGARLKRINLPKHPDIQGYRDYVAIVACYLDHPGGTGSGTSEHYAPHGILDGDDHILLVSTDTSQRLTRQTRKNSISMSSTSGCVVFQPSNINTTELQYATCPITGVKYNTLEVKTVWVVQAGAKPVRAVDCDATRANRKAAYILDEDEVALSAFVDEDVPTYDYGGRRWVDDDRTREWNGYTKLSQKFYPHLNGQWVATNDGGVNVVAATLPTDEDANPVQSETVMRTDCAHYIHHTQLHTVHVSLINDRKKYVPVHRLNTARPAFTHKDNPSLVLTRTHRKCIRGVHSIVELWDGSWEFNRNATYTLECGYRLYYSTAAGRPNAEALTGFMRKKVTDELATRAKQRADSDGVEQPELRHRILAALTIATRVQNYGYTAPEWTGVSWQATTATMPDVRIRRDHAVTFMLNQFEWARAVINGQIGRVSGDWYGSDVERRRNANFLLTLEACMYERDAPNTSPLVPPAAVEEPVTQQATDERFVLAA